jgi:hypothetical protein
MGGGVDVDSMSYEELQRLCDDNGDVKDKAANDFDISRLPCWTFTKEPGTEDAEAKEEDSCSICLCEFETGESVKTLPCFHRYHAEEIDKVRSTTHFTVYHQNIRPTHLRVCILQV